MHKGQWENRYGNRWICTLSTSTIFGVLPSYSGAWTCRDAGNYESRGGVGLSSIVLDIRTFRIKAFTFKPRVIHILLDY